jgi:tRNA threonylcarbamoyladenosine biosynthesis protein TsaB
MSLILNIDTALGRASVCLSDHGESKQLLVLDEPQAHAASLHQGIASILENNKLKPADLEAVGVSIGPGSYTGLRVGLSAAKGLCYALQIPLVAIGSLKIIALAARDEETKFICPMIDARRMEVFTALYDSSLREIISPCAMIIDENSLGLFPTDPILFCGSGSKKIQPFVKNDLASFSETVSDATHLGILSNSAFQQQEFADLAYTEPLYIKEFFSPFRK